MFTGISELLILIINHYDAYTVIDYTNLCNNYLFLYYLFLGTY